MKRGSDDWLLVSLSLYSLTAGAAKGSAMELPLVKKEHALSLPSAAVRG